MASEKLHKVLARVGMGSRRQIEKWIAEGRIKVDGGTAPIIQPGVVDAIYSNPLPQVLILTAIVVGISTTALGLALIVRIYEAYGTIEEDETQRLDIDE